MNRLKIELAKYLLKECIGSDEVESTKQDFTAGWNACKKRLLIPFAEHLDEIEGGEPFAINELKLFEND